MNSNEDLNHHNNTTTYNNDNLRAYNGYSSSIADMHADDEDCCALACCGICLQARNEHIVLLHDNNNNINNNNSATANTNASASVVNNGYVPVPFWRIVLLKYAIYYIFCLVLGILLVNLLGSGNDPNDDNLNKNDNTALIVIVCGIAVLAIAMSISRKKKAVLFRRELRHKMLQQTNGAVLHSMDFEAQDFKVHNRYGCYCFSPEEYSRLRMVSQPNQIHHQGVDFCTKIWNMVSDLCFGYCCSCWCQ